MVSDAQERPRLTAKGERTRARIIRVAARLVHERGVTGTTLDDVRVAAEVSGSQLTHYFVGKEDLLQAVIDYQADVIVGNQRRADLGTADGLRAWRDMVIAAARSADGMGGCPLGSLGGQLAESDPQARARIAGGFERWSAVISDGLRSLHGAASLPDEIDPDDIATTLLAALQGGLLLAQVQRSTRPLETAVDTIIALVLRPSSLGHRQSAVHGHDGSGDQARSDEIGNGAGHLGRGADRRAPTRGFTREPPPERPRES